MSGLVNGILLVVEFCCGAAAGIMLGRNVRSYSWGHWGDGFIGGIGGLIFTWPSMRLPGLARFVGDPAGGLTPAMLIGAGVTGLLGGVVLVLLAGFVRAFMKD